jgi:hypothetical protein
MTRCSDKSAEMIAAMTKDMPLVTVINFADIDDERLEQLLAALNGEKENHDE